MIVHTETISLAVECSARCWIQELLVGITYRNSYPQHLFILARRSSSSIVVSFLSSAEPSKRYLLRLNFVLPPRSDGATGRIKCLFSDIDGELFRGGGCLSCLDWFYRQRYVCSLYPVVDIRPHPLHGLFCARGIFCFPARCGAKL